MLDRPCVARCARARHSWACEGTAAILEPERASRLSSHLRFADMEQDEDDAYDSDAMDALVSAQIVQPAINAKLLEARSRRAESIHLAALSISKRGYCVCHGGIDADIVADAASEAAALFGAGTMSPGHFTIGGDDSIVATKRHDHTLNLHSFVSAAGGPELSGARTLVGLDNMLHDFGVDVVNALARLDRPNEPMGRAADGSRMRCTGRTVRTLARIHRALGSRWTHRTLACDARAHYCCSHRRSPPWAPILVTARARRRRCAPQDSMVTCYPGGGAKYGRHWDNLDGDGRGDLDYGRTMTLLYYLNDKDWDEEAHGGALRIHLLHEASMADDDAPYPAVDILPRGDTIVIFRADRILHEVRAVHRRRFALSMWLYGGSDAHVAAAAQREAQREASVDDVDDEGNS